MSKTAVIVGAGPGLGNHIAEKFGCQGFRVVLFARREEELRRYQAELEEKGVEAAWRVADASDADSLHEALESTRDEYGAPDVLVYNVGVTTPDSQMHIDADTLIARYRSDVVGAYACIQEVATEEFAQRSGAILVTGGRLAMQPEFTFLPLSMDKAALRAMVCAMHPVLKERGIYLGMVAVAGGIKPGTHFAPDLIAERFWDLYEKRDAIETIYD